MQAFKVLLLSSVDCDFHRGAIVFNLEITMAIRRQKSGLDLPSASILDPRKTKLFTSLSCPPSTSISVVGLLSMSMIFVFFAFKYKPLLSLCVLTDCSNLRSPSGVCANSTMSSAYLSSFTSFPCIVCLNLAHDCLCVHAEYGRGEYAALSHSTFNRKPVC